MIGVAGFSRHEKILYQNHPQPNFSSRENVTRSSEEEFLVTRKHCEVVERKFSSRELEYIYRRKTSILVTRINKSSENK